MENHQDDSIDSFNANPDEKDSILTSKLLSFDTTFIMELLYQLLVGVNGETKPIEEGGETKKR